jgi:VanZ family protein
MPSPDAPPVRVRGLLARVLAVVTAGYTAFLVWATHHPRPEFLLGPNPPSDKTLHFIAYGGLAVLAAGTLALARHWTPPRSAVLAGVLAIFAAVDEITQPFFKRSSEPLDWVYDCLGIGLGIVAVAAAVAVVRLVRGRQAQLGVGGR